MNVPFYIIGFDYHGLEETLSITQEKLAKTVLQRFPRFRVSSVCHAQKASKSTFLTFWGSR